MFVFPTERKKIACTIKRYERLLRKEQEETGAISDGFGKRYLLGILYLLLDDTPGAMLSFEWFERTFEDEGSEPFHSLSWTLALYRSGRIVEASRKLRHTMLLNLYMIPHVLGKPQSELQIWHASNWCQKSYLNEAPPGVFELWQPEELDWMEREYSSEEFRAARARYIEIFERLNHEPVGPLRSLLVAEAWGLEHTEPGAGRPIRSQVAGTEDRLLRDFSKSQKRRLRELSAQLYERDLQESLTVLSRKFDDWKSGKITSLRLGELLHEYDYGESRRLWSRYATKRYDLIVARGLVRGLLTEAETGSDLVKELQNAIAFYREEQK